MKTEITKTLQIVAIQHELVMSVGLNLNLDKMLTFFSDTVIRRLNLRCFHIYLIPEINTGSSKYLLESCLYSSTPNKSLKSPEELAALASLKTLMLKVNTPFSSVQDQGLSYYGYKLGSIGYCVLVKQLAEIDQGILQCLIPVFERLAISIQLCAEHQKTQQEISARKKAELALSHQATHDELTGLPNRKTIIGQLHKLLSTAKRYKYCGAVYFLDLNKFKLVNDTHGHNIGDQLLLAVAEKMRKGIRKEDLIARIGGDEFLLVAGNLGQCLDKATVAAKSIADTLMSHVNQQININGSLFNVSISIGIAMFPSKIDDINQCCDELIRFSDAAMYKAKSHGKTGCQFFSMEMQIAADRRSNVEAHLLSAIDNREFSLFYQPITNHLGKVVAAESLLRWDNPILGSISPDEFISIAESSSFIVDIGKWVLNEACRVISLNDGWFANGLEYISVNISPKELAQPDFIQQVLNVIKKYEIAQGRLQIEITETTAVEDIDSSIKKLHLLIDNGVNFSLDDFGTGYSSLSYLHRLPLDTIKIDRSFIFGLKNNIDNQAVTDAAIAIASRLGIHCIAEGVEDISEVEYLQSHQIYGMQGYYFSRPLALDEFKDYLKLYGYRNTLDRKITPDNSLASEKIRSNT